MIKVFYVTLLLFLLLKVSALAQQKLNLNKASLEELKSLPGIGEQIAKRIIEYRERVGGFKSLEELKNVKGIGEKKFEVLKNYLFIEEINSQREFQRESSNFGSKRALYYYKDEKGVIHYTQFPELVPEKYKKSLRVVK
ncbi:MAG: ComEA family DNA-binding protein [Caldimicrobium sp.]|nr:ComEA family DNA-binding protein [Caldimicrobium sp.]MCX7874217.1 ComEA family DNA-binding protein [Caldimicrobium sp.]MDW8094621.1 ComEA family DNA-binding protein [Caldimicrobium sp.]